MSPLSNISTLKTAIIWQHYHIGQAASPHLTYLGIHSAYKLTSLPEEIRSLKNLWLLDILGCLQLEERCRKETGEDWPKIAHIPEIPNHFSHFHSLHFYYLTFKMLWHHFVLIILHIAWNSWQP